MGVNGRAAARLGNPHPQKEGREEIAVPLLSCLFSDTSPEAEAIWIERQRAMSGEQRMILAYDMSIFARELAREGIRRDHPDWNEAKIARELLRLAFLPALPCQPGCNERG